MDIIMSDFIDVKSPKAKGKRITTLDIDRIEDITPEPEPESEPEQQPEAEEEGEGAVEAAVEQKETPTVVDVPFTVSAELPEDSKPVDDQLSLF